MKTEIVLMISIKLLKAPHLSRCLKKPRLTKALEPSLIGYAYIDFPAGSIDGSFEHSIIGQNNLDLSFNSDNTELTINFREQLDYIPVILPYTKKQSGEKGFSAVNDSVLVDVRLGEIDQNSAKILISKATKQSRPSMKLFVGLLAVT